MRAVVLGLVGSVLLLDISRLEALHGFHPQQCDPCPPSIPDYPDEELSEAYQAGYNASARINDCSSGIYIDASFIYWNVSESYLDFGRSASYGTDVSVPSSLAKIASHQFSYRPGFQVGLGYVSDYDGWCVEAAYTWIKDDSSTKVGSLPTSVSVGQRVWIPNEWFVNLSSDTQQQALEMISKWHVGIQYLDVLLSRPFYQGYRLTVTPYAGLKALWVGQHMEVDAFLASTLGEPPATSLTTSQLWSIGPSFRGDMHWLLGKGVRLETDVAFSLLYSHFANLHHRESFDSVATGTLPISGNVSNRFAVTTVFETDIGFGWGAYFTRQDYHFDFSLSYHFAILSQQNKPREIVGYFANNDIGYSNPIGDLFLHGLKIAGRLDF